MKTKISIDLPILIEADDYHEFENYEMVFDIFEIPIQVKEITSSDYFSQCELSNRISKEGVFEETETQSESVAIVLDGRYFGVAYSGKKPSKQQIKKMLINYLKA